MLFFVTMLLAASGTPMPPVAKAGVCAADAAPADRLQSLDHFRESLSAADRHRLDQALPRGADGGIARCDRVEGSRASCEAAAYLPALRKTGLMARYTAAECRAKP